MIGFLYLLACAGNGELDQPAPPPTAPPQLAAVEADVVTLTGVVSEIHSATRSFIALGDGRREIGHMTSNGTLEVDGKAAQVSDLVDGMTIVIEGKTEGDLMLVRRAIATSAGAVPTEPTPVLIPVPPTTPATPLSPATPPAP